MKHYRVTLDSIETVLPLDLPTRARKQTFEPDQAAASLLRKNQKVFSVSSVIPDGRSAGHHAHVTDLALVGIAE